MEIAESILNGDRLALARLLTQIENGDPAGMRALNQLYPHTGSGYRIGITGAPGTGKSTLANRLALHLRKWGWPEGGRGAGPVRVAVVAVDPSSPFTGGAILGDRIRMRDLAGDSGIFIRSMATRGALGGVAKATADMVSALDAAGFDVVLIETVGAGQAEVDIAKTAQSTLVVDAPGRGDDVQANKAGILEIADVMVVNKADLPGAENTIRALRMAIELGEASRMPAKREEGDDKREDSRVEAPPWRTPVLATVAARGEGLPELVQALHAHREYLKRSGELRWRERERVRNEVERLLRDGLAARFHARQPDGRMEAMLDKVLARKVTPYQAMQELLEEEE